MYVLLLESGLALGPRDGFVVQGSSEGSHFPGHCAWSQDGYGIKSEPMRPIDFHGEFQKEGLLPFSAGLYSTGSRDREAEGFPLPHGAGESGAWTWRETEPRELGLSPGVHPSAGCFSDVRSSVNSCLAFDLASGNVCVEPRYQLSL